MLFTTLTLALAAAVASAGTIHSCAGKCIGEAIMASGCESSDSECICASEAFHETYESCIPSSCSYDEQDSAYAFAEKFCKDVETSSYTPEEWESYFEDKYDSLLERKEKLDAEYAKYHAECQRLYALLKADPTNEKLKAQFKAILAKEKEIKEAIAKWKLHKAHLFARAMAHGCDLSTYEPAPEYPSDPSTPEYPSDPSAPEYPSKPVDPETPEYPYDPEDPSGPSDHPDPPAYPHHPPPHGYPHPVHQSADPSAPVYPPPTKTPCTTKPGYTDPASSAYPYPSSSFYSSYINPVSYSSYIYPSASYPMPSATVISYPSYAYGSR